MFIRKGDNPEEIEKSEKSILDYACKFEGIEEESTTLVEGKRDSIESSSVTSDDRYASKDFLDDNLKDFYKGFETGKEHISKVHNGGSNDSLMPRSDGGSSATYIQEVSFKDIEDSKIPTKKSEKYYDEVYEQAYENAQVQFADKYPDITDELGGQDELTLLGIKNAGYKSESNEFNKYLESHMEGTTIMWSARVFLYDADNSNGSGKGNSKSGTLQTVINWVASHNDSKYEDSESVDFVYNDTKELENVLKKEWKKLYSKVLKK